MLNKGERNIMIYMLNSSNNEKNRWIIESVKSKEHIITSFIYAFLCVLVANFGRLCYVIPIIFFIYSICISFNKIILHMIGSIIITFIVSLINPVLSGPLTIHLFIVGVITFTNN